ncbi:MAG: DUF4405 domain-containing protein [Campylobacterota bacterium]|nr:DUF4405 domain-containing protein [Campylobacterota bacterium]
MKKITSLSLGFSFLIMGYTGIILYIAPHGRISKWLDWHLFGLDKTQYQELHTTSMITFLFFGIMHIYFNWKAIVCYMTDSAKKITFTKKEFLIAFIINAAFVAGTLTLVQPFKGFLDFGESLKSSWGEKSIQSTSSDNVKITIKAPPEQLGQKTLEELSDMGNINLKKSLDILKSQGAKDVDSSSKMRHIANDLDLTPTDIYKLITQ